MHGGPLVRPPQARAPAEQAAVPPQADPESVSIIVGRHRARPGKTSSLKPWSRNTTHAKEQGDAAEENAAPNSALMAIPPSVYLNGSAVSYRLRIA